MWKLALGGRFLKYLTEKSAPPDGSPVGLAQGASGPAFGVLVAGSMGRSEGAGLHSEPAWVHAQNRNRSRNRRKEPIEFHGDETDWSDTQNHHTEMGLIQMKLGLFLGTSKQGRPRSNERFGADWLEQSPKDDRQAELIRFAQSESKDFPPPPKDRLDASGHCSASPQIPWQSYAQRKISV